MANDPIITIIIPAWNCERRIVKTLAAIGAQTVPSDQFEVLVIDNGSTDGTAKAAQEFDFVTLLSEPLPGSYRARNRALSVARGEYVLFTDGDCVPREDWVEQAFAAINAFPDVGVYAGRVVLFRETGGGVLGARYEEFTAFNQEVNVQSGHCVTANWLCRRDDLRAVGGFNAELLSGGDVDCSRRMIAAGHKLLYVPELVVGHPTRATLWELTRKRRRVVGGRWEVDDLKSVGVLRTLSQFTNESTNQARWTIRSDMRRWEKAGVVAIIGALLFASFFEVGRLATGRSPYRS